MTGLVLQYSPGINILKTKKKDAALRGQVCIRSIASVNYNEAELTLRDVRTSIWFVRGSSILSTKCRNQRMVPEQTSWRSPHGRSPSGKHV